jgi:hypothetical protein
LRVLCLFPDYESIDFNLRLADNRIGGEVTPLTAHPTLQTFVKRGPYEVRHLLVAGDDPGAKTLIQITAGVRTEIATGTQYEMQKREDELMQQWNTEGFTHEERAFESWNRTLTLLTATGYHAIFDPQLAKTHRMNPSGRVLLTQWAGRRAKGGGEYEYAFDGNTLVAQPKLPPMTLNYTMTAEFAKAMLEASKLRDSLGPTCEFVSSRLTISNSEWLRTMFYVSEHWQAGPRKAVIHNGSCGHHR